jgi:rhamnose utilization protein RhaD (predicted bifunctional aldolase and dehydrogenase)
MLSLWNEAHTRACASPLALRAYSSRLLGAHRDLVLHGGGNTSYKTADTLYVKGSGADLAEVTEAHFTPLDLADTRALLDSAPLSNEAMFAVLETLKRAPSPKPSIETLLHAALPQAWVEHTHADAVLALTNTVNGESIVRQVFAKHAVIVPYHHSGATLARAARDAVQAEARSGMIGVILMQHGACAWGESAHEAYQNMLHLATLAEDYLKAHDAWDLPSKDYAENLLPHENAQLEGVLQAIRGRFPFHGHFQPTLVTRTHALARAAAAHPRAQALFAEGPATPQHAIFCKRVQLVTSPDFIIADMDAYAARYAAYLAEQPGHEKLDPAPRIFLLPGVGFIAASIDERHANMAAEMFEHDSEVMLRAERHDRYQGLDKHWMLAAEIEYGGFEAAAKQKYSANVRT